jgi:hypothetical protein
VLEEIHDISEGLLRSYSFYYDNLGMPTFLISPKTLGRLVVSDDDVK